MMATKNYQKMHQSPGKYIMATRPFPNAAWFEHPVTWEKVCGFPQPVLEILFLFVLYYVTFILRFDKVSCPRFLFSPIHSLQKTNHTGVTSHDFLRQPYVSAFESMLVAVVLTASRGENPIHRGSCWQRTAVFFSIFFLRTENKIIPFARQTIFFQKSPGKKNGCKGVNTNAYHIHVKTHIYLS